MVWYSRIMCLILEKCGLFSSVNNSNSAHSISILQRSIFCVSAKTVARVVDGISFHTDDSIMLLWVCMDVASKHTFLPLLVMGLGMTVPCRSFVFMLS